MLVQLSARCGYLPHSSETDRPCLGYVRGERHTLLIDAGNSPAHHALMLREMARAGLPAPTLTAITHSHWDHTYGMCAATGPVLVNDATQAHLTAMSAWAWTLPAMEARLATGEDILFCHECILKEYPDLSAIRVRPGDVTYHGRLTVDLGGIHAELIHLDNSHADDCSVIYVPEEKLLFLGDILCCDLHHDPRCLHQGRFAALRRGLEALDFALAVEGHGSPLTREQVFADMDEHLTEDILLLP